jgi:hypothetical protein
MVWGKASEPFDAVRGDGDPEGAFVSFVEGRATEGVVMVGVVGVENLHIATAENLESIVEVRAGSEVLGAEAGAGIVDFEELDGLRGVVAHGSSDIGGVAAGGGGEKAAERKGKDGAHKG